MKRVFFLFPFVLFMSCQEVAEQVSKEIKRSMNENDSLAELNPNDESEKEVDYVAKGYEIIQRKKEGKDSLFLVRSKYIWGKPFADVWYRNRKEDGLTVMYHKDGSVFYKILFKDGKQHTVLQALDCKGKPLDHGNLKDGNGRFKHYDPVTDHLISVMDLTHGLREGDFISYYQTGELHKKGSFKHDVLNGPFTIYFKNGKTKETGAYTNGALNGEHTIYFRSGAVRYFQIFKEGVPVVAEEYDRKGKILIEGKRLNDADFTEIHYDYADNGDLRSKGMYRNNMKHGTYAYFENKKIKAEELWRNDSLFREKAWHANGNLRSFAVYVKNQRDSIYTEYYSNGKLRLQQGYRDGFKEGIYISYFENGNKYVEGMYKDDKPFGKFKHYHKDGTYNGSYTSVQK